MALDGQPMRDKIGKILYYLGAVALLVAALLEIGVFLSLSKDEVWIEGYGRLSDEMVYSGRVGAAIGAVVFAATAALNFFLLHTKPPRARSRSSGALRVDPARSMAVPVIVSSQSRPHR